MIKAAKKLSLAAAGTIVALLLAELTLRVLGIGFPLPYAPDPHAGWRMEPGFSAWFGKEGGATVHVNRQGFRDVDHEPNKPADTIRVAVLGDSFAEAVQVPIEQSFWSVLANRLESCSRFQGKQVEVLNFGVSGYGTAQQLQILRHEVWQYQPDVVLLAFFGGNDVRNNSPQLETEKSRPFFVLDGDRLELDTSFRDRPDYLKAQSSWTKWKVWLINRSKLLQLVNEIKSHRSKVADDSPPTNQPNELGVDELCFAEPRTDPWRDAWTITERLIATMAREADERGADFWVATVPAGIQIHPEPKIREALQAKLGVTDLFYPEDRLEQLAAHEKFDIIPLGRQMLAIAESREIYLHGFPNTKLGEGHWNEDGHRIAGDLIAKAICSSR